MATFNHITDNQLRTIEAKIHPFVYRANQFLGYMKANKLIMPIPKGTTKFDTTIWEEMPPGQITRGFSDLPQSVAKLTTNTNIIMDLGIKIKIPKNFADAWKNNKIIPSATDMLADVIFNQTEALRNQVDQFICQGDNMRDPLAGDELAGVGQFTGLFNGFTNLGAGNGKDNNTSASGDYISDFASRSIALKTAGFENQSYTIMSNLTVLEAAQATNNLFTTNTITTEWDAVMAREDVFKWIASVNAENSSNENQILVLAPRTPKGAPNFRLLQGYNFDIIPLYNGGLGPDVQFEVVVFWSGAMEEIRATSVQRSGSVTV